METFMELQKRWGTKIYDFAQSHILSMEQVQKIYAESGYEKGDELVTGVENQYVHGIMYTKDYETLQDMRREFNKEFLENIYGDKDGSGFIASFLYCESVRNWVAECGSVEDMMKFFESLGLSEDFMMHSKAFNNALKIVTMQKI